MKKRMACLLLSIASVLLCGCETMQALGGGEVAGKPKAYNYSYTTPDRYRAGFPATSE